MFYTSILCLLIILSCCSESQSAKRHFNLELRNVTCSSFTDIVRLVDCDVRKLAENRFGMDVMFYLNRPVPLDADIEILLHYRVPKSTRVVSFINIKMKICDILQHATTVPIVKEVLNGLARFSNLPLTCPVKGVSIIESQP
ncbi:uncharacterized protein LOC131997683 [Stomoxys calcitrans]|uniref:uncharacterized protein LOC131997683 n=1 Tax=Stomoxys calcitrans TaxID=35570 RepID=UPI0027E22B94|nr:uncharacterized protein LOC131997683 [Stomoxys calcitrans]